MASWVSKVTVASFPGLPAPCVCYVLQATKPGWRPGNEAKKMADGPSRW